MRDFCYIVRECYILTADTREHGKISCRGQIRTQKTLATDLQLNAKQRVLDDDASRRIQVLEMVRTSAQLEDAFAIDSRQPRFSKLFLDFLDVGFYLRNPCNPWLNSSVNNCDSIRVCSALITRPGKIPRYSTPNTVITNANATPAGTRGALHAIVRSPKNITIMSRK